MRRKKLLTIAIFLVPFTWANAQSLEDYISKALEKSPLLWDLNNQLQSGRLDSLLINATYKPQVNQVSQAMYAPYSQYIGYDEAISNGGNFATLLNVAQPLFNKKIKKTQFDEISLSNQAIEVNRKITQTELKQDVTSQYLTTYADFLQIQFNQSTLTLLKEEQTLLKSLVNQGLYPQTDLMNLTLSVTAQEISIKGTFIQFKNNLALLNFICGISDTLTVKLVRPDLTIRNSFDIGSSPTIMKFRIDSLKNVNTKFMVDLNYRPKVSAFADAGFMAVAPENIPHNFGTSFGLNLTLPLYDGQQRKIQYNKTALAENSRSKYKEFYSIQYGQQINQLTEQLKLTNELISKIKNQLSEQEKLIELYKIEIEKGLVRFIDFLNIVNNYTATKNNLTLSEMNRLQIINKMNYLK